MRTISLVVLVALSWTAAALASEGQLSMDQKREWLRDRIAASSRSADARQAAADRVAKLTDNQVEALSDYYRSGKADKDLHAAQDLDRKQQQSQALRSAAIAAYQQRLAAARGGRVGYAPVITTLPSGASLAAGAVVSPDRRYVRINAAPFFSQVNGFSTFNMANGQTRYYPMNPSGGFGVPYSPQPLVPQVAPQPQLNPVGPRPALQGYVPHPALQPR